MYSDAVLLRFCEEILRRNEELCEECESLIKIRYNEIVMYIYI